MLLNVFARKKRMKKEHAALGVMTSLSLSFVASFPSLVTVLVDLVLNAFLALFGQRPQRAPKSLRPVGYRDEFPDLRGLILSLRGLISVLSRLDFSPQ